MVICTASGSTARISCFIILYQRIRSLSTEYGCTAEKPDIFLKEEWNVSEGKKIDPALMAYMLGFGCHYILDSTCHPYVNKVAKKGRVSHTLLEKEFDRMLMYETGKNPSHFYPSHGIKAKYFAAKTIHKVLPEIRTSNIYLSLKMMKIDLYESSGM